MDLRNRSGSKHSRSPRSACLGVAWLLLPLLAGCWAPLVSHGIPARTLPDDFRMPIRTAGPPLNFASLTIPPQADYILGPNDVLEVLVHNLYSAATPVPARSQVMASGYVHLPMVGAVHVGGMNLLQAQEAITKAYADDFIGDPRVNVYVVEKSMTTVLVLGDVVRPGVYPLPKYENDVAHALASAGGLGIDAGLEVEVHRRIPPGQRLLHVEELSQNAVGELCAPPPLPAEPAMSFQQIQNQGPMRIVRIPLRGFPAEPVDLQDIILHPGDVVVVPSRKDEVFFVVGKLSATNFVRFNIGERERDLGAGFVLPRDREIDVVTAVAMAGYIDPIDSPTTVTVHRVGPDARPMLVRVDLIKARYDARETIMVQPGDIIYLNPDLAWWSRRTFDRVVEPLISLSYRKLLGIGGGN